MYTNGIGLYTNVLRIHWRRSVSCHMTHFILNDIHGAVVPACHLSSPSWTINYVHSIDDLYLSSRQYTRVSWGRTLAECETT